MLTDNPLLNLDLSQMEKGRNEATRDSLGSGFGSTRLFEEQGFYSICGAGRGHIIVITGPLYLIIILGFPDRAVRSDQKLRNRPHAGHSRAQVAEMRATPGRWARDHAEAADIRAPPPLPPTTTRALLHFRSRLAPP